MDQQRTAPAAASSSLPALGIDAGSACLVGANAAGWRAWGLDPATVVPPVAIDGAMPALERLRATAGGGDAGPRGEEELTR